MEYNENRHLRTKRIAGFKRFEAEPLLRCALMASVLGTLLFAASSIIVLYVADSALCSRSLLLLSHLLRAFGFSMLLWAIVSVSDAVTGERDDILCAAVFLSAAYHLSAAIGGVLAYRYGFYYATLVLWWLRTLAGVFVAFDFIVNGDRRLQLAGVLLVLTFLTGCPYRLVGTWGLLQWILAKVFAIAMYVQLYRCAVRIYNPAKAGKDPLDTPGKRQS